MTVVLPKMYAYDLNKASSIYIFFRFCYSNGITLLYVKLLPV